MFPIFPVSTDLIRAREGLRENDASPASVHPRMRERGLARFSKYVPAGCAGAGSSTSYPRRAQVIFSNVLVCRDFQFQRACLVVTGSVGLAGSSTLLRGMLASGLVSASKRFP
jgi:hypothetical protein